MYQYRIVVIFGFFFYYSEKLVFEVNQEQCDKDCPWSKIPYKVNCFYQNSASPFIAIVIAYFPQWR